MRSDADVRDALERYADMVERIAFMYMKNRQDAEDVFQNVFLKYALFSRSFESAEHKKAWLARVAINTCKSQLGSAWRKRVDLTEEDPGILSEIPDQHRDLWRAVRELGPKYRAVIYLHYFEGYKAAEIGKILGKRENTVYSLLARGREQLREALGDDD